MRKNGLKAYPIRLWGKSYCHSE